MKMKLNFAFSVSEMAIPTVVEGLVSQKTQKMKNCVDPMHCGN